MQRRPGCIHACLARLATAARSGSGGCRRQDHGRDGTEVNDLFPALREISKRLAVGSLGDRESLADEFGEIGQSIAVRVETLRVKSRRPRSRGRSAAPRVADPSMQDLRFSRDAVAQQPAATRVGQERYAVTDVALLRA